MKSVLKQLFCRHIYGISRWHFFHGFNGNEPARLEVEHVCCLCGKKVYSYPKRGSNEEQLILSFTELQE